MKKKTFIVITLLITLIVTQVYALGGTDYTWKLEKAVEDSTKREDNTTEGYLSFLPGDKLLLAVGDYLGGGDYIQTDEDTLVVNNDDSTVDVKFSGDEAIVHYSGFTMYFKKYSSRVEPTPVKAGKKEDFNGNWVLRRMKVTKLGVVDIALLPKLLKKSMEGQISILNDTIIISIGIDGNKSNENGKIEFMNGELKFSKNDMTFNLLDTGELAFDFDENFILYFSKAETENEWICENCKSIANGKFCNNCGAARPISESVNQNKIELNEGMYVIGEDVPAGTYRIQCTEANDYINGIKEFGSMMGVDYGGYIDALGSIAEPYITVRVTDNAGYTVKQSDLKVGESVVLVLKNGSLNIYDGKCVLIPE